MIPLTLEEIRSGVPLTYKVKPNASESIHWNEFKETRKFYGKNLVKVTPSVARQLIGKTVYGLQGQNWMNASQKPTSVQERMNNISKLHFLGFEGDDSEPFLNFKSGDSEYVFSAYIMTGAYVTGGGGDPIYVFAKKGAKKSRRKSSRRSRRKSSRRKSSRRRNSKKVGN